MPEACRPAEPSLDDKLRWLRTPAAHRAAEAVQAIETHMSWVFLAGDRVLKLKKPVRFPFLDFSTLAAREHDCREEVRLNARLAPGVYLGVVALQWHDGAFSLAPERQALAGRTVDWLVAMRRLPEQRMLDRLIARGEATPAGIDALIATLGRFYLDTMQATLPGDEYAARLQREQAANREVLLRPQFRLDHAALALDRLDRALLSQVDLLYERCALGRIVEGHGDLRPEHVCMLEPPVVIDCLEFNARLREVDPFDEIAFLGLECALAGAAWIGPRLLAGLSALLDDQPPAALIHLYTAQRALMRARLAMAHLLDPQPRTPERWAPFAQRCVRHALAALDRLEGYCPLAEATSGGPGGVGITDGLRASDQTSAATCRRSTTMNTPPEASHPQVGAIDPNRETSPIVGDEESLEAEPNALGDSCRFNGAPYPVGAVVLSGTELLRCEAPGLWVRQGEWRPGEKTLD